MSNHFLNDLGVPDGGPESEQAWRLREAVAQLLDAQMVSVLLAAESATLHAAAPSNAGLRSSPRFAAVLGRFAERLPDNLVLAGPAPVVTFESFPTGAAVAHRRMSDAPIPGELVVSQCPICPEDSPPQDSRTAVPFWVPMSGYIAQIDVCSSCAVALIADGFSPQIGLEGLR